MGRWYSHLSRAHDQGSKLRGKAPLECRPQRQEGVEEHGRTMNKDCYPTHYLLS